MWAALDFTLKTAFAISPFHVLDSIPTSMSLRRLRPRLNGRNHVCNIVTRAKSHAKRDAIWVVSGVCHHLRTPPPFKEDVYLLSLIHNHVVFDWFPYGVQARRGSFRIGSSLPIHAKSFHAGSQGQIGCLSPTSVSSSPSLQDTLQN